MSAEILVPCAQCGADIGVILGTGSRDDLARLRCWRCDAGLPPLPKPEPPPALKPHPCPPTSLSIYQTGWKCGDCGQVLAASEIVGARPIVDAVSPC
jgi:DNA-directed RNA polymerase subunit RPC12/RpoP